MTTTEPSATAAPTTLVTDEMRAARDRWSAPDTSYPVTLGEIRRWAIAVYWPEKPPPLFWDEAYAQSTRWGGIIAPQDFNPFAWPLQLPAERMKTAKPNRGVGERSMNGGQRDRYGAPIRPGDLITRTTALVNWEEKVGRLGLTLYYYYDTRWSNQRGEHVRTRTQIGIRY
jgi:hypothetical protein